MTDHIHKADAFDACQQARADERAAIARRLRLAVAEARAAPWTQPRAALNRLIAEVEAATGDTTEGDGT